MDEHEYFFASRSAPENTGRFLHQIPQFPVQQFPLYLQGFHCHQLPNIRSFTFVRQFYHSTETRCYVWQLSGWPPGKNLYWLKSYT
jgi:hypothetical protein